MELTETKKLAQHIFRLLKVTEIIFPIGRTNKGNLGVKFSASSDDFEIMLDAIPLSTSDFLNDENNIELKKMLEKYWFEQPTFDEKGWNIPLSSSISVPVLPVNIKKRGRPAKTK